MDTIKKVVRAGVIPAFKENGVWKYMFMKPSNPIYGGDSFQIAKGHVEDYDESNEIAAIREGGEELGLRIENIKRVEFVGTLFGRTHLYVALVHDKGNFAQTTFETGETIWLSAMEFSIIGRELHKPVINTLDVFCENKFT